jgi:hypothetical protein
VWHNTSKKLLVSVVVPNQRETYFEFVLPVLDDDSQYVEKALHEYQVVTWGGAEFVDLPWEVQHEILRRAATQNLCTRQRGCCLK